MSPATKDICELGNARTNKSLPCFSSICADMKCQVIFDDYEQEEEEQEEEEKDNDDRSRPASKEEDFLLIAAAAGDDDDDEKDPTHDTSLPVLLQRLPLLLQSLEDATTNNTDVAAAMPVLRAAAAAAGSSSRMRTRAPVITTSATSSSMAIMIMIMMITFLLYAGVVVVVVAKKRKTTRKNTRTKAAVAAAAAAAVIALVVVGLFHQIHFLRGEFPAPAVWSWSAAPPPLDQQQREMMMELVSYYHEGVASTTATTTKGASSTTTTSILETTALNHFELNLTMHRDICWNDRNAEDDGDVIDSIMKSSTTTSTGSSWPLTIAYPKRPPDPTFDDPSRLKFLALYFPQWYPAPENNMHDDWAYFQNPNFTHNHHHVPIFRPRNNMYYDSRCYGIRKTQAALAKKFLLDGFVYYFYYFNNTMMLPEVNERMLVDGEPDLDFAFMWINGEPFAGFDQDYSLENIDGFVNTLAKYFSHPRYIHVNNRPVLYLYHGPRIPGAYMQELFVRLAAKGFMRPYIVASIQHYGGNWLAWKFADAYAEFPPNTYQLWKSYGYTKYTHTSNYHLGLNLNFDNTPRLCGGNPERLPEVLTKHRHVPMVEAQPLEFLQRCIARVNAWSKRQTKEKVVLIFAWNEWSEQGTNKHNTVDKEE